MASLGIVLLVTARTGSYSEAGRISAVYVAAEAIGAVPLARLVDRRGQSAVLGPAVTVSVAAMLLLIAAVEQGWPAPWPHPCAVVAGAVMPNIGAGVRARSAHVAS